jgi:hypothetical protein
MPIGRVRDEPSGLVEDEQIVVLVEDREWHLLSGGTRPVRPYTVNRHFQGLPGHDPLRWPTGWPAVNPHAAFDDPRLHERSRKAMRRSQVPHQDLIDTVPVVSAVGGKADGSSRL